MLLRDRILLIASAIGGGDASPYTQELCSRSLVDVANEVTMMQELADGLVAESQSEEHLLAVCERRSQIRLVR